MDGEKGRRRKKEGDKVDGEIERRLGRRRRNVGGGKTQERIV